MILLSFDIEEFDTPMEHGINLPIEEQMRISIEGTKKILNVLKQQEVKATFFCTANYALRAPELIKEMLANGHEVASHGYYHSTFEVADLLSSRNALEELTGRPITGYRMARMMPVDEKAIADAGYTYNSSLNPTCIPGRYCHLNKPRRWFYKEGVLQLPVSVTPWLRFPLFWLSCHHLPTFIYHLLALRTYRYDGYLITYFHPWEFVELGKMKELNLPYVITHHSGQDMVGRLNDFIAYFKSKGVPFATFPMFIKTIR
ncbi:MAG: polysaccharide deacetylase family protein [Tannerellaceae bacterium]